MGGATSKSLFPSHTVIYDEAACRDPRSPSIKRTPLAHAGSWRQNAALLSKASADDPRSPSVARTPIQDQAHSNGPITPLTLSYGECRKVSPVDPRSPMAFRTPINYAQGGVEFDTSVVACGEFVDDTEVVDDIKENKSTEPPEAEIKPESISSSTVINTTTLSSMSIVGLSKEIGPQEEEEKGEKVVVGEEVEEGGEDKEYEDVHAPSSPLVAPPPFSAREGEGVEGEGEGIEVEKEEERKIEKATLPKQSTAAAVSAPGLLERKRKKGPTIQPIGVSPLKKSNSSPSFCSQENDENASPQAPRHTPTTPRRTTPTTPRRTTPTTPNASRRSLKSSGGNRSPLSPITPRSKRSSANIPRESSNSFLL